MEFLKKHIRQRHESIIKLLANNEDITTSDLQDMLKVSNETLRKDLILLEERGMLVRTHGGATLISSAGDDKLDVRKFSEIPAKRRIAEAALKFVPESPTSIVLDAGNTVWFLSRLIKDLSGYTIVTNSLDTSKELSEGKGSNSLYCTGGLVRNVDYALYGNFALNCIKSMGYSVSFLGTSGVKNSNGMGAISFDDRDIKVAMRAQSDLCVALLDSTKFDKVVLLDSVNWEDIDVVITDSRITDEDRDKLDSKTKLIIV